MKIVWAGLLAVLLAAFAWSPPASAQVVPRGSYLNTCNNVVPRGDTTLQSGDEVLVLVTADAEDAVHALFIAEQQA